MPAWLARRLAWAGIVLLVVAVATFVLTFIAPTDPVRSLGGTKASPETVARVREALGLDRSGLEQLVDHLARLARLDLGTSLRLDRPVLDLILARLPATIELAVAGLLISMALGIPAGVRAATRPGGTADRVAGIVGSVLVSTPAFLLGIVLFYALAFVPHRAGIEVFPLVNPGFDPLDMRTLFLPALALGLAGAPFYLRITRTAMLDELSLDHIRTARAKGLSERQVTWSHALRNAASPIINQAGLDLGLYLGGVVVIEWAFSWPGIGQQALRAVRQEDLPLLMGTVLFATAAIVLANLAADLLRMVIDPRLMAED